MGNKNVLKAVLPLAVIAGGVGGVVLDRAVEPRKHVDPVIRAEVICPAQTDLVFTESHYWLSNAVVKLSCEDASGQSSSPLAAGSPGIRPLDKNMRTAPPSILYIAYIPKGGETPGFNDWVGDMPYDLLQLEGASAVVDVSDKKP